VTPRLGGVALLVASLAGSLRAQERAGYQAYAPEPPAVVSVAPGEHYAAGRLHQAAFGRRYRDLWATPIQVPLLDLAHFAGGLTPEEQGGGMQTTSLRFEAGDGREFSFRSIDKDPTDAVPEPFRSTVVHRLVQDGTSAMNPAGAVVAPVLLEAAGVLNAPPQVVVMPDDPRLGEYRAEFAGLLGMIEERPDEGFGGAAEVIDTDELEEKLRGGPGNRVDAGNFLAARLVDQLLGDWDRHRDQWRWAAFPEEGGTVWRPVPRDRDQALVRYDGFVSGLFRRVNPKLVTFGPDFPANLAGFTWNGRELDRAFLAPLDAAAFDSVAGALQAALTDAVIDAAVRRLPAAHHARWGAWTADALRRRRDALRDHARRYYRYLATDVEVWGTDAAEIAEARWADGALHLSVRSEKEEAPGFARRFDQGETDEVRLHLREGDDRVVLAGARTGPRLLIVREPRDTVIGLGSAGRVQLHEHHPEPADDDDSSSGSAAPEAARDWGSAASAGPSVGHDPDLGLLLGAQAGWTDYAFRHAPYRSRTRLSAVYATAADGLRLELASDLRRIDPRTRLSGLLRASEIEMVRFNGFGNETPRAGAAAAVAHWQLTLAPSFERDLSPSLRARVGPVLRYGTTDRDPEAVVRRDRPLGSGGFGRIGAAGELSLEAAGVRASAGGGTYAPLQSGSGVFGELHGEARLRVPLEGPTLAARLGAKRVWGRFPFDEAALLGGARTLRGYDYQRFAGNAMLYGGVELRVPVARVLPRAIPTRIGVIGLSDWGRVWASDTRSDRLHASAGAGIWLEFFEARHALSLVHARGREGGHWYLQLGLPY
jgi:hypothetical protein